MTSNRGRRLCLALVVPSGESVSESALLSSKPYVDFWIVYSNALTGLEKQRITTLMAGIDGQFIEGDTMHLGDARNALLETAQTRADWVLLIDANEKLCSISPELSLPLNADLGLVELRCDAVVRTEARLFKTGAQAYFDYPTGECFVHDDTTTAFVTEFSIASTATVSEYLKSAAANRFLLDAVLGRYQPNAQLHLCLGKIELANNQLDAALTHFARVSDYPTDEATQWMAHYLAGNIHNARSANANAIQQWHRAFELAPHRAEPLMRLAELHFQAGDIPTAGLIAKQASEIESPIGAPYYEPEIYTYSAAELTARAWHALDRTSEAINLLRQKLSKPLGRAAKQKLQNVLESIERSELSDTKLVLFPDNANKLDAISTEETHTARPKLTIGMATHDDYDGVYFTVMSLVLYHQQSLNDVEILIVDNNPSSKHGAAVRGLSQRATAFRYIRAEEYRGTAIRECVFQEARGDYVLCLDCHVFLHAGALRQLIQYFDANPDSNDILHGPIFYDNHKEYSTHMEAEWREGFFGRWGRDERGSQIDNSPFEIPMQGLGLFACVKKNWPGFNLKFRGFGGEEGYIHEKFRQRGGKTLCLPFLRWTHRFDRPNAPTYTNSWEDRLRNYLIGWDELALDTKPVLDHFCELLGEQATSAIYTRFLMEKMSPLWHYNSIYIYSVEAFTEPPLPGLGVQRVVQQLSTIEETKMVLQRAIDRQLPNVLLLIAKTQQPCFENAISKSATCVRNLRNNDNPRTLDTKEFQAILLQPSMYHTALGYLNENSVADLFSHIADHNDYVKTTEALTQ